LEHRPGADNADGIAAALGAGDFAVRPLHGQHRLKADFQVAVVADGIEQGFRGVGHATNKPQTAVKQMVTTYLTHHANR
jgi:hypothetical protein